MAQLGARLNGIQEVTGSNPVWSTKPFREALLKRAGVSRHERDEIANLAILAAKPNRLISSQPPDQYLARIADAHRERLTAQSVPPDRSVWRVERYDDFLAARRERLAEAVNDLIGNRVGGPA